MLEYQRIVVSGEIDVNKLMIPVCVLFAITGTFLR